ncbi:hypothetical protein BDQ17DRAFT_1246134, partial [Cyathus striatus]
LEHNTAHQLFDPNLEAIQEFCGLCLCPTEICEFYLKKCRGTDGSLKINYDTSTCVNLIAFSYGVAAQATDKSPCTNVPVLCHWCLPQKLAVWKYNMISHIRSTHPTVSICDQGSDYHISNVKEKAIKSIWNQRDKLYKAGTAKHKGILLVVSEAHISNMALGYVTFVVLEEHKLIN